MNDLRKALETLTQGIPSADLRAAYDKLSKSYREARSIKLDSPALQLAYLQARMPATVAVLTQVLSHIKTEQIDRLLDLGSGPGSVLWAAQEAGLEISEATCVDQSEGLLSFGQKLLAISQMPLSAEWLKSDLASFESIAQPDLVTMSYVLNELSPALQAQIISKIWKNSAKHVVLVEPGTPKGFQNIRNARDQLIKEGAYILAPCTHEKSCPMSGADWCHFSARVQRSKAHKDIKGTLSYEDEKYSYLIVSKQPVLGRPQARIVKRPTASTGLVELELCDEIGLSRVKISKRQGEFYKKARKVIWGDGLNM